MTNSFDPTKRKATTGLLVPFVLIGLAFYVTDTTLQATSLELKDGATITNDGNPFIRLSEFPKNAPDGAELGKVRIKMLALDTTGRKAAVVVSGANHDWIGILDIRTKKFVQMRVLAESSAESIAFSHSGTLLAFVVVGGSGLRSVSYWETDGTGRSTSLAALLKGDAGRVYELDQPEWAPDDSALKCRVTERGIVVGSASLNLVSQELKTTFTQTLRP